LGTRKEEGVTGGPKEYRNGAKTKVRNWIVLAPPEGKESEGSEKKKNVLGKKDDVSGKRGLR